MSFTLRWVLCRENPRFPERSFTSRSYGQAQEQCGSRLPMLCVTSIPSKWSHKSAQCLPGYPDSLLQPNATQRFSAMSPDLSTSPTLHRMWTQSGLSLIRSNHWWLCFVQCPLCPSSQRTTSMMSVSVLNMQREAEQWKNLVWVVRLAQCSRASAPQEHK
jgi:hypothetical protein